MIDDTLLRQVAVLQASLKMLESHSDVLSDPADMKELGLYKSRLSDYIEAQVRAGDLPRDPFQAIEQRLSALSEFFAVADQEFQRLKSWKAGWINSVPAVGLADLQSARTELAELVAEVPRIQERLAQRLSPLDWNDSLDLHAELLACAQCVSCGEKLPQHAKWRQKLYQFTRGEGDYAKETSAHFTAMGLRIDGLIALHAAHVKALADTEHHLSNDAIRSAEKSFLCMGKDRFSDVDYTPVESRLAKVLSVFVQFKSLDASLDRRLEMNESKAIDAELDRLRGLTGKPESELARETMALLQGFESRVAAARKAREKRKVKNLTVMSLLLLAVAAATSLVINEYAKAGGEAVFAKEKAEAAYAKSSGKRAGEEKVIQISPGVTMTFCWCPAGKFTMGSPPSEADRGKDENQVEVTLSRGFWMAKTEVTQAQWQAVMGANPSHFKGTDRPVENVSWNDTQVFLKKVNALVGSSDGGKMALPTEAQWEYAARAGDTGPFSGGTLDEVSWNCQNNQERTHPVGTKKPNAWGLHDVHGNVAEWCWDLYGTHETESLTDPQGATSGTNRMLRGGCWGGKPIYSRAAFRGNNLPSSAMQYFGFRVARSSVLQSQ